MKLSNWCSATYLLLTMVRRPLPLKVEVDPVSGSRLLKKAVYPWSRSAAATCISCARVGAGRKPSAEAEKDQDQGGSRAGADDPDAPQGVKRTLSLPDPGTAVGSTSRSKMLAAGLKKKKKS